MMTGWRIKGHSAYLLVDEQRIVEFIRENKLVKTRSTAFPSPLHNIAWLSYESRNENRFPDELMFLFNEGEIAAFSPVEIVSKWRTAKHRIEALQVASGNLYVLTKERKIVVVDRGTGIVSGEFYYPLDLSKAFSISGGMTSAGRLYIDYSPLKGHKGVHVLLNQDGSVEKSWEVTYDVDNNKNSWVITRKGKETERFTRERPPNGMIYEKLGHAVFSIGFHPILLGTFLYLMDRNEIELYFYIVSLFSVLLATLLCWLRLRKRVGKTDMWTWMAATALLGWPIYFTCLCVKELPGMAKCPGCGRKARLGDSACGHCGARWSDFRGGKVLLIEDDAFSGQPATRNAG